MGCLVFILGAILCAVGSVIANPIAGNILVLGGGIMLCTGAVVSIFSGDGRLIAIAIILWIAGIIWIICDAVF